MKPKIYVFVNSGQGTNFQCGMAMAEDGTYLTGHISSHRGFFLMDMGLIEGRDWSRKRDVYAKHYPDGYDLVEVPDADVATHPGLAEACAKNQAKREAAT